MFGSKEAKHHPDWDYDEDKDFAKVSKCCSKEPECFASGIDDEDLGVCSQCKEPCDYIDWREA